MRNKVFTVYKGYEFELQEDFEGNFELLYRGYSCPISDFVKYHSTDVDGMYVFTKILYDKGEVTNAYSVSTYALYKGFKFQVSNKKDELFQLVTGNENAYRQLDLEFVDRGYYLKWVDVSQLEKMWEERKKSGYDLPMPDGIREVEEINL